MRTDSKHDGIKHEHVIFTQACPRSRQILATPRIVLYSSPVSIFIPSECQQTEKSGEGIEFSLRENMGLRWPEPIYMCVGYVLKSRFSAGKM